MKLKEERKLTTMSLKRLASLGGREAPMAAEEEKGVVDGACNAVQRNPTLKQKKGSTTTATFYCSFFYFCLLLFFTAQRNREHCLFSLCLHPHGVNFHAQITA